MFKSSVVTSDDEKLLLAFFNGGATPTCVALLECNLDTASALERALGSVLGPRTSEQ